MTAELPRLFVSIPEAAKALGISRTFAYELAERGDLPTRQLGRRKLVPVCALERMAAETAGSPS